MANSEVKTNSGFIVMDFDPIEGRISALGAPVDEQEAYNIAAEHAVEHPGRLAIVVSSKGFYIEVDK